jgi:hypothetical protein
MENMNSIELLREIRTTNKELREIERLQTIAVKAMNNDKMSIDSKISLLGDILKKLRSM